MSSPSSLDRTSPARTSSSAVSPTAVSVQCSSSRAASCGSAPSRMRKPRLGGSGRVEDLPWIEDVVGVERLFDRAVHLHHWGRQFLAEAVPLEQADAVLAGDGAAERDGVGDDLLE